MRLDHFGMYPERAFQRVAGRMTLEGGKGSAPAAPDYSAMAQSNKEAAQISAGVAREQLAFQKDVYERSLPQQARLEKLATDAANQQMQIADANQRQAQKQWDYYENTYQPVEKRMVDEAMNYDSKARQEQQAGQATADVRTQMANANAQQNRALTGMGVNPNSGRFAGLNKSQAVTAGASAAGAATGARNAVVDKGIGLRAGAASFGRNMPNTAAQSYGLASGATNSAVGNANTGFMSGTAYPGLLNSGYSNILNANQQQINSNLGLGSLMNQTYATQSNFAGQQAAGEGAMTGSAIGMVGMIGAAAL